MTFENLPVGIRGAGSDIIISLTDCDPDKITEVHVVSGGETLGIKRFRGEQAYEVNVSCYLKDTLDIRPYYDTTSVAFISMPSWIGNFSVRAVQYAATEDGPAGDARWLEAGEFPYTAGTEDWEAGKFIMEMDGEVEIRSDDVICLPILTGRDRVESMIRIIMPNTHTSAEFRSKEEGIYAYFVNTAYIQNRWGIPLDDTIELAVEMYENNRVAFSKRIIIRDIPEEAVRLCWVNRYGTVDYYTFSTVQHSSAKAAKTMVLGEQGYKVAAVEREETLTVTTPYMTPENLERLSGILSSPRVWLLEENGAVMKQVDILTRKSDIAFDAPGTFPLTFRYC